jgi:hypothetical protein
MNIATIASRYFFTVAELEKMTDSAIGQLHTEALDSRAPDRYAKWHEALFLRATQSIDKIAFGKNAGFQLWTINLRSHQCQRPSRNGQHIPHSRHSRRFAAA